MNREIKFRAWHEKRRIMLEYGSVMSFHQFLITPDGLVYDKGVLQPITLMQYTGLKDKNGREIYEGDIVKIMKDDWSFTDGWGESDERWKDKSLFNPMPQKEVGRDYVTLEKFRLWLKNESFGYEGEELVSPEDCIVIGNIYKNPELLEKK